MKKQPVKTFIDNWLNNPKFSWKLFLHGLVLFFVGVALVIVSYSNRPTFAIVGWPTLVVGVLVALPGYVGIWRWRWIKFKNDK